MVLAEIRSISDDLSCSCLFFFNDYISVPGIFTTCKLSRFTLAAMQTDVILITTHHFKSVLRFCRNSLVFVYKKKKMQIVRTRRNERNTMKV